MARNLTMRGRPIDYNKMRQNNSLKPAIGNAGVNARGDLLGKGGVILKTQEQIEAEWARAKAAIAASLGDEQTIDIKEDASSFMKQTKKVVQPDQNFEPISEPLPPAPAKHTRRKIIDSDV